MSEAASLASAVRKGRDVPTPDTQEQAMAGAHEHSTPEHSTPEHSTLEHSTQGRGVREHVVIGVDGSEHSVAALRWGLRQAARTGADVQVVGCWQWPASAGGFMPFEDLDLTAATQSAVDSALAKALHDLDLPAPPPILTRVVEGYPARALVDASREADLLVIGSRGHGALSGMLLGSVGLHCASSATCPVVVVRGTDGA